jgi:hypothetical protein
MSILTRVEFDGLEKFFLLDAAVEERRERVE